MDFENERVFTSLNADELRAGDKVIVADDLDKLKSCVKDNNPISIIRIIEPEDVMFRFAIENNTARFALAYLVERKENCTNCEYEGSAGCSVVEICGENKLTHRCHMYKAKDTKKNLCISCKYSFAECPATANDIIFGDGIGNDNVCECDKYEQKSTVRCINCEHYSTYEGYCNKHVKPTRYDNTNCKYYNKVNDYEQKAEKLTDHNHCEEARKAYACAMTNVCPNKHCRPFKDTDELIKTWIAKRMITYPDLCLPHIWVRRKKANSKGQLITEFGDELHVSMGMEGYNMTDLFVHFTFLDGSPCGVEE